MIGDTTWEIGDNGLPYLVINTKFGVLRYAADDFMRGVADDNYRLFWRDNTDDHEVRSIINDVFSVWKGTMTVEYFTKMWDRSQK